MGGRLITPGTLCREPGGSEPTPDDLQAMLSASAGLSARGHSTAAGALLGDDEDEDDEYGPKRPVAPKVNAAHALQLTRTPQLSGLLCLSTLGPTPAGPPGAGRKVAAGVVRARVGQCGRRQR